MVVTEPLTVVDPGGEPPICGAIRLALEQAGMSQQELAELLGVRQTSVSKWTTYREPRLDRIASIEDAIGLRRGSLLRMAGYVEGRSR